MPCRFVHEALPGLAKVARTGPSSGPTIRPTPASPVTCSALWPGSADAPALEGRQLIALVTDPGFVAP